MSGAITAKGNIQSPQPDYAYDETSPLLQNSSSSRGSSQVARSPVESGLEEDSKEASVERSDLHKNKDFQLVHVPKGRVGYINFSLAFMFQLIPFVQWDLTYLDPSQCIIKQTC